MLGLVGPEAKLEGDGPLLDRSSLVQAVCCTATPTDLANWGERSDGAARFGREGGLLAGPAETLSERAKKASPMTYVHTDAPPFLVVHGTADRTVPVSQGDKFVKALQQIKADVAFLRYDGAGHGVFAQHGDETFPAMETFFDRVLRKKM
ncbi:MAG: S9 family peptidase [Planctomycetales bacterium]